jgi:SAM-dependent methyltransferase
VSTPAFLGRQLDTATRAEFFRTGTAHVDALWSEIARCFVPDFRPDRALDFGCGVGRVALPLAARCRQVLGVDIAPEMVAESRANAIAEGISNVTFEVADGLDRVEGLFDFVHSMVVLQHVPPRLGYGMFERLVSLVAPGGIGAIHVTYSNPAGWAQRARHAMYARWPALDALRRRLRPAATGPAVPMHAYDLGRLLLVLEQAGTTRCQVELTNHGLSGALIVFQRQP